jgi:hypothetical protein
LPTSPCPPSLVNGLGCPAPLPLLAR